MLPLAAVERIARKSGIERISAGAIRELAKSAEEVADAIVREAAAAAKHAHRSTIMAQDIRLVARKG